jgi:hypothetical protein
LTVCRTRFVRWCAPGSRPNRETSSRCDSQVSGCQFALSNRGDSGRHRPGRRAG